ncbi:MAG: mismatch-specific DNA-glycosylase [Gemmatimonadetes bacterium]|nr:mismatch-specific DNA-glycosylase [Gemmatimonadota bacterium]
MWKVRHILPDVLAPGLGVVFCGTAAGAVSARKGAYYAGPGNRFWHTLHQIGLTSRCFEPAEFARVLECGIGLTDVAKTVSGSDRELPRHAFDSAGLERKIRRFCPRALAFNGKRSASQFFHRKTVHYGRQDVGIGETVVFVLPSTSGAARKFWDATFWFEVARFVQSKGVRFRVPGSPPHQ